MCLRVSKKKYLQKKKMKTSTYRARTMHSSHVRCIREGTRGENADICHRGLKKVGKKISELTP